MQQEITQDTAKLDTSKLASATANAAAAKEAAKAPAAAAPANASAVPTSIAKIPATPATPAATTQPAAPATSAAVSPSVQSAPAATKQAALPLNADEATRIQGRFGFNAQMSSVGLMIRPIFIPDQGHVQPMEAALFPTLGYALDQIEQLKQLMISQYDQAARLGALQMVQASAPAGAQPK